MCAWTIFSDLAIRLVKSKSKTFTSYCHEELTNLFVHIESHLFLTKWGNIPFGCLLVGIMSSYALGELLEVFEEIRLHSIFAHAEQMLQHALGLRIWCIPQ